jgi:anti-sigma factor RsiW
MLSCREVVEDADRWIAGELPWRQRLAMRLHLSMCRHCRRYVHQLKMLIRAVPSMHANASEEEVDKVMDSINSGEK